MEKIMIIDPDIGQIRDLNRGLSADFRILNCSRADKAMELFRLYQPWALILDPATPGLNPRAFIREARSLSRSPLPVLALTRITLLRHIEDSFGWGVDALFSKPCSPERVRRKLEVYFRGSAGRPAELTGAGV